MGYYSELSEKYNGLCSTLGLEAWEMPFTLTQYVDFIEQGYIIEVKRGELIIDANEE
jgi:hypothetical protein